MEIHQLRSTYLIDEADYIACHNQSYVNQYDLLKGLKKGGTFRIKYIWSEQELETNLTSKMKKYIAKMILISTQLMLLRLQQEIGLGNRINMIMQSAFFKLANIIPEEEATKYLKNL